MKARQIIALKPALLMASAALAGEVPTEPRGGQPPKGSKASVENFADQITYQRAFEAVVWSMSAMIKYGRIVHDRKRR